MDDIPDGFRIDHSTDGSAAVVRVHGEVDAATAPLLADALEAAGSDGQAEVVVDCGDLTFIDSAGLSVLVAARRRLGEHGHRLALANPTAATRRVLAISGVDRLLTVREP